MEGISLVLVGASMFAHSWYLLGLYPEGRTMGIYVAALGLAALIAMTFAPQLLIGQASGPGPLAELIVMKMLIIIWVGHAVGVGAQGIWEFDERALGFYSAVVTATSVVALIFFATNLF